jgi:DNA primase
MANPGDFAYTVKQQADIVRIVGEYVKLRKAGAQNWSGLCPFHNEKTGSFSVHQSRQFYHCFGCGASGDVFSFVQKIENITFPEAVKVVAQKLGIALPKMEFSSPQEARDFKMRGALLDAHEVACAWFQEQLKKPEAANAREYLAGRGLTEKVIGEFRIGFAPDAGFVLRDYLKPKFGEEILVASGLLSWKQENSRSLDSAARSGSARDDNSSSSTVPISNMYAKFRNRIMFPICNESGKVIAFTGRILSHGGTDEKSGPKYLNSPETPIYSKSHVLFNLDKAKAAIRKYEYAILVEGQMDCISVYAAGVPNVIATSGTAFTEPQVRLLGRHTKNIVVNFDPDTAGAAAAERSLALLTQEDFQIKVLTLEAGFDPDLFVREKGVQAYVAGLKSALKYFDYLIERARAQFPARTPEGKVKAVNFLIPHIQRVPSRIARDELANEIAQRLDIDSAVLRQELRHVATARSAAGVKATATWGSGSQVTGAERILVRALASPGSGESVSTREGEDSAFDPARQVRFVLQSEPLHQGWATESLIDQLLESESDPMSLPLSDGDRRLLAEILMHDHEEITPELIESAFKPLRKRHIEKQLAALQRDVLNAQQKLSSAPSDEERTKQNMELARLAARKSQLKQQLDPLEIAGKPLG